MAKKINKLIALVLSIVMMLTSAPFVYSSAQEVVSTEISCPFNKDTIFSVNGENVKSNSYRIPAMVTLADGTIVAAADIRWNTTYDGGGLDTLVARSTDGGATWSYTVANYLGDNGNQYNGSSSTAFLNPSLTVGADGKTMYMLVDLYPYGVALNGNGTHAQPSEKVGFNSDGYLLLSGDNHTSYSYYLKDGKVYNSSGTPVEGYEVDEFFNISGPNEINTNLFCEDSPYKVVRTGYLYLTSSKDGGATWSAPILLNVKTSSERVCLVAPGSSITTGNGTMIFPVYSYHGDNAPEGNTQRLSFIYSKDGVNWSRTSEFNHNWASEAAVVELQSGRLRFFFRNGTTNLCYVDYDMESGWGSAVTLEDIATNSNTQISAITYSRTSDGKQVILVSCSTGSNRAGSDSSSASNRLNGSIFVFTVDTNGAMNLENTIMVNENNSQFMYSCMTEREDGSVLILYEDQEHGWGVGDNCYYTMDIKGYTSSALGISLDDPQNIIVDANGIVTVAGSIPEGVTVSAKAVSEDNVGKYGIKGEVVAALDIKLLDPNGNEVQPNAPVTVTLDASAWGLEDGSVVNIHHNHDGNVSVMSNYLILNGKLTFTVSDFSIFIVENVGNTDKTQQITANSTYEMTVGESKIFYWAQQQDGSHDYDCVWYVEDPDGLIDYEVTKADYTNEQYTAPWITVNAIKASTASTDGDSFATITLRYDTNGNTVYTETFYIEVANPDSALYIDNQIPENGCLVPQWNDSASHEGITYTWSRSSGVDAERKVILEEAYNEANNGVNVSIDSGGVINGRDPITYTVTAKDADGNVLGTAQYKVLYGSELLNTGFEYPDFSDPDILDGVYPGDGDTKFYVYNGYPGFYWKTTAPGTTDGTGHDNQRLTDDIEIIQAGGDKTQNYYGLNTAAEGKQFAEVNAEAFGALYQDVLTTPGAEFTWQFSHRGRSNGGENTLYIVVAATKDAQIIQDSGDIGDFLTEVKKHTNIGSNGEGVSVTYNNAEYRVWKHEGNLNSWDKISGTYDVPADQYLTRLFFVSDTNNNDNNTMGNFIDAVSAGETLSYQIQYYVDGNPMDPTTVKRAQVHSYTSETFPNGIDLSKYSITTVTANGITYPYDLNLNGRAYQLYITAYGAKKTGQDADIIFEIHLRSKAITVKKEVVIDGFDTLDVGQKNAIINYFGNDGFKANFTLNSANNTPAVVNYIAETNTFIGTAEFALTSNGTYRINEDSCTEIPGYILSKTEFSGGTSSAEGYKVAIDDSNPVVAITCTNTYTIGSADLTIVKKYPDGADYSIDENQTFIFTVKGVQGTNTAGIDLTVTIHGNGEITITDLPIGDYVVTEQTDWSWRYDLTEWSFTTDGDTDKNVSTNGANGAEITLGVTGNEITFTNKRTKIYWLDGDSYKVNIFKKKED